jgi:hypothetical protein
MTSRFVLKKRLMLALVFMFFSNSVFAVTTANSVINEAHTQLLARHRSEAITLLLDARKAETNPVKISDLDRELTKATQLFLSNEGQRRFENAESTRHSGQTGYLASYEEALKLEPLNARVLVGYGLALIAMKKCAKAVEMATQLEAVNPYSSEYKLLHFKTQLCSDPASITKDEETDIDNGHDLKIFRKTARAQQLFLRRESEAALTEARQATKIDDRYAQAYFWAWKVLSRDDAGLDEAQRYLTLCKNVSAETRRVYTWEPELCANTDEVEEFLHKQEAGKNE